MPAIKYDIFNEQFDAFFLEKIKGITAEQKSKIPQDILNKLFRKQANRIFDLSHKEKEYILAVAFGMKITIVMEDAETGITAKEFRAAADAQKAKITNSELLKKPGVHAGFVRADKELFNSLMYISHVHTSEVNKLVRTLKESDMTKRQKVVYKQRDEINAIIGFILRYEQRKRQLVQIFDLDMPKIYALLYFYSGPRLGKNFYARDFVFAYNCNSRSLSEALTYLQHLGYMTKRGVFKNVQYSLTSKGMETVSKIVNQILSFINTIQ